MLRLATIRRCGSIFLLAGLFSVAAVRGAHAEGFISPFLGYNFSGDSGCPNITGCEDKHANYGVSFGALGSVVGFEEEFAYTNDFFGKTPNGSSTVITLMSNFMLAPKLGPVQPYGLAGVGLIRTTVSENVLQTNSSDTNQIGWDIGGGVMIFFNAHVGIRGDIRYYHSFQVLDLQNALPGLQIGDNKLDYGRASGAFVFKF
jgi:opacity protein-like surface antigen